jgi:RNA polymerase sigma-32 factor
MSNLLIADKNNKPIKLIANMGSEIDIAAVSYHQNYPENYKKKSDEDKSSIDINQYNLSRYIREVNKFPVLSAEEELQYGLKFKKDGNKEAAKMLIQSHLRLVVKIAMQFKSYGLSLVDLISEGNVGLMQALKKFEPEKGFRFSTYAMWWIKANIQEFILKSWSLVRIGTTIAQKKLFFNLNKIKKKLSNVSQQSISNENVKIIANSLGVSEKEVKEMNSRMTLSDSSLNQVIDSEEESELGDFIASSDPNQEEIISDSQTKSYQETLFKKSFAMLNVREQDIITKRHLTEKPLTLEELSKIYNISRERIRQIEEVAIKKIKKFINQEFNSNNIQLVN